MGLTDLHLHTIYSCDGMASVSAMLECTGQTGLNVIAIEEKQNIRTEGMEFHLHFGKLGDKLCHQHAYKYCSSYLTLEVKWKSLFAYFSSGFCWA